MNMKHAHLLLLERKQKLELNSQEEAPTATRS